MSSLRELDRVEDRIRQHRQVEKAPVLVVEGPDDLLVLKTHIASAVIFPADGRANVLRAVDALEVWAIRGVLAVIDADFEDPPHNESIYPYEGRDLEGMLVALGVLAVVLEHQGSSEKLSRMGGPDAVVADLVANAIPVARLRAANSTYGWGLNFDGVDLASKADRETLAVDLERYCAALARTTNTTVLAKDLVRHAREHDIGFRGPRGKDVAALAGVALRRKVGTLPAAVCVEARITTQLRSSAALLLERSSWLETLRDAIEAAREELERAAA